MKTKVNFDGQWLGDLDLRVEQLSVIERFKRSFKTFFMLFGAGLLSIFIPVLHFVLVPAFLISSFVFLFIKFRETRTVNLQSFDCPSCNKNFNLKMFALKGDEDTIRLYCNDCRKSLTLTLAGMNVEVRAEAPSDFTTTEDVIKQAFAGAPRASGKEWLLVKKLRYSTQFIPDLSLVALMDGKIIGHILLTPIEILSSTGQRFKSLAMAPVSVLPEFQGKGVGGALIDKAHHQAKLHGYNSVIVLGHANYYPRFGYKRASDWSIKAPFQVPDEVFMAKELETGALKSISGVVEYPPEFNGI